MLRKAPAMAARQAVARLMAGFRFGPSRLRLRRRLLLFSAPVMALVLVAAVKMISVVVVGGSAATDFGRHDIDALADDVAILRTFDVIDPAKTSFADADLLVLEGRLEDAAAGFSDSLSRTGHAQSCPARVNLELVQETLGDLATRGGNKGVAEKWYTSAITVVTQAPGQCFAGNDDPDPDRRAIRAEALPRLQAKLRNLHRPPAPEPPPPTAIPPQPLPTSLTPMPSAPPIPGQSPGPSPSAGESPGTGPAPGSPGGPPVPGSPGEGPAPGQPPPGPGPNMPTPQSPEPTLTPGPGPNMPAPPTASGGDAPLVGPEEGAGPDVLNPVGADRLPSVGSGGQPGQRLGVGSGDPLDRLRILLENANAHGDTSE
jgi:hypothetical protein